VASLYRGGPVDLARVNQAQAIVIPGGGVRQYAPEYGGGGDLGHLSLDRVRYGAFLARRSGLPVLVTGGIDAGGYKEAELMAKALTEEFGVTPRWTETVARNTHESAVRSAAILRAAEIDRIVLVGHAFDIPRARAEFEAAGLRVLAAPTYLARTTLAGPISYLPTPAALETSYYACYELLALAAHRVGLD
jgi:uncharacterized SAM-binding protein YcdF (DUF218 family)